MESREVLLYRGTPLPNNTSVNMVTYIRENIKGYYIEFPEKIDAEYWEGKIGTTYQDFLDGKWVKLSDEQVAFHEEHLNASVQEVLNMEIAPAPERTLEDAKHEKTAEILDFDDSDAVNSFNVMKDGVTVSAWLTPAERANYRSSIDSAELVGVEELSLYIGDMPVTLPTPTAKLMLAQIQLYADQCFIVTKQHETAVAALSSIEAVDAYDVTAGYPQKLTFTIEPSKVSVEGTKGQEGL